MKESITTLIKMRSFKPGPVPSVVTYIVDEHLPLDLFASSQVVLRSPGGTGIQVQINTRSAVGIADIYIRERLHDSIQLFLTGKLTGHIIHLDKNVFMVGIRAHLREIDLWYAIVVDIVPVSFQLVGNMIAVAITRVGALNGIYILVLRVRRLSGLRFHRRNGQRIQRGNKHQADKRQHQAHYST